MIAKLFAKYQSIGLITLSLLAGAIMTFIALPVLTRLYSVADFGAYGIALAIVSILSTVANLRLDQALLVADEQDKKSLIFEGAVFSTAIAVISGIVISTIRSARRPCSSGSPSSSPSPGRPAYRPRPSSPVSPEPWLTSWGWIPPAWRISWSSSTNRATPWPIC